MLKYNIILLRKYEGIVVDHTGHRHRLRWRFEENGLQGFSDHEILELLLTYAIPRIDVNPLAHKLMTAFGSFDAVLDASPEELKKVDGMGERSAALLSMMVPVFQRYEQQKLQQKKRFTTYSALASYCNTLFMGAREEQFYLLCFDAKLQLIKAVNMAIGTADEVHVSPKQIVREALRLGAVTVAVTHNHPSGDPKPSPDDIELTRNIKEALDMVEIRLADHVVVGALDTFSIFRNSLLERSPQREDYLVAEENEMKRRPETGRRKCREDEECL